jgi:hypothetical protein
MPHPDIHHSYDFTAPMWLYETTKAPWHFISVPEELSAEIRMFHGQFQRGWGAVPVTVRIGSSQWQTSMFPDKKTQTYLLPIKADIRKVQQLTLDTPIQVSITPRVGC